MESRYFIKAAKALTERIRVANLVSIGDDAAEEEQHEQIQKELNALFSGLFNPTLPSAFALRDTALQNGFTISAATREKLAAFENWSC